MRPRNTTAPVLRRVASMCGLVVALVGVLVVPAAATAGARSSATGNIDNGPYHVALGPDGNMWFTHPDSDRIGRVTTGKKTRVKEFGAGITRGGGPEGITAGPDGNLWFTEFGGNRIGRITPGGEVTEFAAGITQGSSPQGITAGPDGNLWFTEETASQIGRITPTGEVSEFKVSAPQPEYIAAGPDGNLWVAEAGGNAIASISPPKGPVTVFDEFKVPRPKKS